jgi:uncharacterized Fe-S cluster-containing protein
VSAVNDGLPGLDCGLCGCRTCDEFAVRLSASPDLIKRCIPKAAGSPLLARTTPPQVLPTATPDSAHVVVPTSSGIAAVPVQVHARGFEGTPRPSGDAAWLDTLDRPFDFFLEHFPEDLGPREVIRLHNPMLVRELEIVVGDVLIGRPLGMSCGCPITHCGVATQVDRRTGVMTWCVTGPLQPREHGYKDLGYYSAEAYEGMIRQTRSTIEIGRRYFFQPRMCMLQWRHSGLVNFLNRTDAGLQVRLEGLWIG